MSSTPPAAPAGLPAGNLHARIGALKGSRDLAVFASKPVPKVDIAAMLAAMPSRPVVDCHLVTTRSK